MMFSTVKNQFSKKQTGCCRMWKGREPNTVLKNYIWVHCLRLRPKSETVLDWKLIIFFYIKSTIGTRIQGPSKKYSERDGNTFKLHEETKTIFLFLVMEDTEKSYFNTTTGRGRGRGWVLSSVQFSSVFLCSFTKRDLGSQGGNGK